MRLSVLDQSPIREGGTAADAIGETIMLARAAERLGYHRYWVAEHHNTKSFAGSAPEILVARLAAETRKIRIGTGGVMLPHYSPLKVAEQFRVLETLAPGRIDLGLGRAPGTDQRTSQALQAGPQAWSIEAYPSQIVLLRQFLDDAADGPPISGDHPFRGVHAMPRGEGRPEIWLLGSGVHSAIYAAELGLPYSHAHFINTEGSEEACAAYRERFKPSSWCAQPVVSLGVAALAADTEEEARRLSATRDLWVVRLMTGRFSAFPSPEEALSCSYDEREQAILRAARTRSTVGTPQQVHGRLLELAQRHGAEELVVVTITYDFEPRLRSYELLAKEFGLAG